jgi:hypothetical protein
VPRRGREPCVERLADLARGKDRDPVASEAEMRVDRIADTLSVPLPRQVDMRDLRRGMDARIRAPGAPDRDLLAGEGQDRFLDRLLDGARSRLALPAGIGAAVIFDVEPVAGHGQSPAKARA